MTDPQERIAALDARVAAAASSDAWAAARAEALELAEQAAEASDPAAQRQVRTLRALAQAAESLDRLACVASQAPDAARGCESAEALRLALGPHEEVVAAAFRLLRDAPPATRAALGASANRAKGAVAAAASAWREAQVKAREEGLAERAWADATMASARGPVGPRASHPGLVHPVAAMRRELEDICLSMGFEVRDGPWAEDEWHNFEALNIPRDHPARDSQDTTWLEDGNLLRTHTSPVQVRTMEAGRPPIRMVSIGRVFRHEALDASHENTFHQIEGLLIDREVHVGHLVGTLKALLSEVFGRAVEVRLRPSFFPFVEPGFELDVRCLVCSGAGCPVCKRTGWVELLGCGLVHPRVLKAGGVDPSSWSGYAFGLGIDRLVMMRHGIEDIRHFAAGDLRFLRQFAGGLHG